MSKIILLNCFNFIALICGYSVMEAPNCGMQLYLPGKIITVAFTPFDDYGNLNLPMVPKLAEYYANNNLKNIYILGYDGEGPALRLTERKALVEAWVEQSCSLGLNIIVEVGLQAFVDTLDLASYCSKKNVSAIKHSAEQVYKAETIEEAVEDLRRVSEAAPNLPLIFSNLQTNAPEITTDAVILARDQIPNFAGVETNINTYLDSEAGSSKCNNKILITIYDIQYMYAAFLLGLSSITLGPNLFPRTIKAMEAATDNCDRETAKKLQDKMNSYVAAISNLDGGTINTYSRTYSTNLRAAFQIITGMNVGIRVPFNRANTTVYDQIACNLRTLDIPLADSASQ